jgi:hypothetical protein
MEKNTKDSKKKNDKKAIDGIILLILIVLVSIILIFTLTRETSNQEIILMEIYKCAGPNTSTNSMAHYYLYENSNTIKVRNSNPDGSNTTVSKEVNKDLITNLQNALDEYINQNPIINTSFYINERYTIEYNGSTVTVPNPAVVSLLGFDSQKYVFYNDIELFITNLD